MKIKILYFNNQLLFPQFDVSFRSNSYHDFKFQKVLSRLTFPSFSFPFSSTTPIRMCCNRFSYMASNQIATRQIYYYYFPVPPEISPMVSSSTSYLSYSRSAKTKWSIEERKKKKKWWRANIRHEMTKINKSLSSHILCDDYWLHYTIFILLYIDP